MVCWHAKADTIAIMTVLEKKKRKIALLYFFILELCCLVSKPVVTRLHMFSVHYAGYMH